jgi:hypothetical protein
LKLIGRLCRARSERLHVTKLEPSAICRAQWQLGASRDVAHQPKPLGFKMSDDGAIASGLGRATGGPTTESKLYGASGEPLRGWRPERGQTDQLAAFVHEQPVTAALAALVIGYFLGKIT